MPTHTKRASEPPAPSCNCRDRSTCPLSGNCTVRNVVYRVEAHCSNEYKVYIGSTGNTFKDRYNQHMHDFRKPHLRTATRLSEYVWSCVDRFGRKPTLTWSILHNIRTTPSNARKICTVCNIERMEIASAVRSSLLNKRSELVSACPHFRRFYFS